MDRSVAEALDAADPLAPFRARFVVDDPSLVYVNGNSLGRLPVSAVDRLADVVRREWGGELVRGWAHWVDLPFEVGDLLGAAVLGAAAGQVVVADSTTVNTHRLVAAALADGAAGGRHVVVTDRTNFPTERYVVEGLAEVRWVDHPSALAAALADDVALVTFSAVDYRTAEWHDVAGITALAHEAGALVLWDLSHAAGAVPLSLDTDGVDLAVGCTYKHLCAGPGAPAYQYVRRELQERLPNPVRGWFGQDDQFAMERDYVPRPGIGRFLAGTPSVLGIEAVRCGVEVVADAGMAAVRAGSEARTALAVELHDEVLAPLGWRLGTPRDPARRGAHVTVHRDDATRVQQALLSAGVVTDFREPDGVRLGLSPLTTRFTDVHDAVLAVASHG